MKILMVSIFAPHFFNWTEQLKYSGHEVYWLDVFDSKTRVKKIDFVQQITGWRYKTDYPGRYFVKNKLPGLNVVINHINERDLEKVFEQKLAEINPDVVHSFVMHLSCFPIYEVMKRNPQIKWIYSSWGSDLYYYQDKKEESEKMKQILPGLDYMFTDCHRDYQIAEGLGFRGKFLGVFPGGGGFDLKETDSLIKQTAERKTILIKGYQGKHGRCITVLQALMGLQKELKKYNMVIFGAGEEVKKFLAKSEFRSWENLKVKGRIPRAEVLELMGQSLMYIGNSLSDGMPNTLLEAVIMGAFPIQSNPGGATAELINQEKNGCLIENPEDPEEIKNHILEALQNRRNMEQAIRYNLETIKPALERGFIRKKVLEKYNQIEKEL
ncbi:Glycosyl transferase 4-like [Salinimicrobium catena]|uniref:Glycosyl transferase 4-like n=1 Tax=Salinimicrobium catena TaxID=390640 RepID=A0A1H5NCF5_9FLAO|nr:glycosyltransferase [Salinimicrobium catena]SDL41130.1 Glycosyl transferase 4-like [Salinimicrobium catena]SEE98557.1 Glycosyl transferase 4-like [Salinimicrobium catena]